MIMQFQSIWGKRVYFYFNRSIDKLGGFLKYLANFWLQPTVFKFIFTNKWVVYGFKNSNIFCLFVYNWYGIFIFRLVSWSLIGIWDIFFRRIPSCSTSLPILSLWISITNALVIWLYPFRYKLALRLFCCGRVRKVKNIFCVCA